MNNLRVGRDALRRRREGALARIPEYRWVLSKRCRKGDTDQGIWTQRGEIEMEILNERLAVTKETSYDF